MRARNRWLSAALPLLTTWTLLLPTTPASAVQSLPGSGTPADSTAPGPNVFPPPAGPSASASEANVPELRAAPLTGTIRVDGHLDDDAWKNATPVDLFTQRQPDEGKPCSERTEVRVLIGDDALFIGARMFDKDAKKIRSRLVRRDDDLESDYLAILIDAYHDHSTAVLFRVSPSGSINDATIAANGNQDFSWDPVWHSHTSIDGAGWTAEVEIPLSQLHYNTSADAVWGIQIRRWINRRQELSEFSFTPLKDNASVARYGNLTGLGSVQAGKHLELLPYATVRSEHFQSDPNDPFRDGSDQFPAAGVDLKYGLTSSLTLNGTVNPDFGEVEVDPAVVNLSAFETFYPEKRPFFVEGANLFRFGDMESYNNFNTTIAFHGRRIGREPQRSLDTNVYHFLDAPVHTTIAGAAKITGKTRSGWSIGMLDAVTPEERADYVDSAGAEQKIPVEPLTNYFVSRVRRDLRKGNTQVGAILTGVRRDLADPDLETLLRKDAWAGGMDLNHYWSSRRWSLDAMFMGSYVKGSTDAIASTQTSSARYYQRPDADYLEYDTTRTSLSGHAGQVSINKIAGKHGQGSLTYQDWSPGFEINDLGFQNAADSRGLSTLALYKDNTPHKIMRSWDAFAFSNWSWNYGGDRTYQEYAGEAEGTFSNYWSGYLRGEWYPGSIDDRLTRGGPLSRVPPGGAFKASINTDSRRSTTLGLNGALIWDDAGGHLRTLNASLSTRPTTSLRVLFEPGLRKLLDHAQYVTTEDDPTAVETYGARYVFASLHQTQISLDTRVEWTFSPKLSFQLYVQPLIVSGDYTRFKELRAPRQFEFDIYGKQQGTVGSDSTGAVVIDPDAGGPAPSFSFDNPDFNFRSFRGNAVLRWEYRPGSALFLVWQQGREATAPIGDFEFSRDWRALFDIDPENVIAVKATYWLAL